MLCSVPCHLNGICGISVVPTSYIFAGEKIDALPPRQLFDQLINIQANAKELWFEFKNFSYRK